MDLSFDTGSTTERKKCPECKLKHVYLQRYILDRGDAYAVALIEANQHGHEPELYFTCTIGTWDSSADDKTHVTFACRYGSVEGQEDYACTLVDVPDSFEGSMYGHRLTRKGALKHERLHEFWEIVDFLLEQDMAIHDFLYHPAKSRLKTTFRLYP
ncbi:hypothetical protein EYC59_05025 [Candidatus Saccharibacteria bacterium]|nr:MAG: hypothetical protein EYC59_05025 [Candidatus Saccharibacteria bacterium]